MRRAIRSASRPSNSSSPAFCTSSFAHTLTSASSSAAALPASNKTPRPLMSRSSATVRRNGAPRGWLIGADGARSEVRRALGIEFAGFTWPERFLVVSTPFDFRSVIADVVSVTYVADPVRWHFLLKFPACGASCFRLTETVSDEEALAALCRRLMAGVVPGIAKYDVAHITLYKVHQRVAKNFRRRPRLPCRRRRPRQQSARRHGHERRHS